MIYFAGRNYIRTRVGAAVIFCTAAAYCVCGNVESGLSAKMIFQQVRPFVVMAVPADDEVYTISFKYADKVLSHIDSIRHQGATSFFYLPSIGNRIEEYFARLDKAIDNLNKGDGVSFTKEEFEDFSKQILNEP